MRVALLLFGQARFLNNPKSGVGIKEFILDRYQPDIFGHTWRSETYLASPWTGLGEIRGETNPSVRLNELYPGIQLQVDDSIQFPYDDPGIASTASHLYSIEQVGKMPNPNTYDWIILTRYDLNLKEFGSLEGLQEGFYSEAGHPGISDQLYIFSPSYLSFCNLYSHYDQLREQNPKFSVEEYKLRHYTNHFPDPIKRFPFILDLIRTS